MSAIPETREIDDQNRLNIPDGIASEYNDGVAFDAEYNDGDIVLSVADPSEGSVMTDANRVYVPPAVAEAAANVDEFAVFRDGDDVVYRPVSKIDIGI